MSNNIELLSTTENFTIGTNSNLSQILANVVKVGTDTSNVTISIPQDISSSYNLILPVRQGASGESLVYGADGQLKWDDPTVLKQVVSVFGSNLGSDKVDVGEMSSVSFPTNYQASITPLSANTKIFVQFKINYKAALSSDNQVDFYIYKHINGSQTPDKIFSETMYGPYIAAGGFVGQYISNLIDEPNTTDEITYKLGYKINGTVDISDTLGILGYDVSYNNTIVLQEFEGSGVYATSVWNKGADSNGLYYNDGTVHIGSTKDALGSQNTPGVALELSGNLVGTTATFSGNIYAHAFHVQEAHIGPNTLFIGGIRVLNQNEDTGSVNVYTDKIVSDASNGLTIQANGNNGNIILDPSGTGSIQLKGDVELSGGNINAETFIGDLSGNVSAITMAATTTTTNEIIEYTSNSGVTIESVLIKDGNVNGNLTGDVTGNITGNVNGNVTGNVNGNLTGDVTGNVNGNLTGDVTGNLTGNVTGTVSLLSNHTTSNLIEGSNLYFTGERVRSNVSGGTGINYDVNTGVFSIGQSVETTSNVEFNNVTVNGTLNSDDITGSNVTVSNDLVVSGNLTVNGTRTIVNTTTLDIGDNKIVVNAAGFITDAGIIANVSGTEHEFVYSTNNNAWGTTGDLNIGGNVTGTTFIGNLIGGITMNGHIIPSIGNTFDIGSPDRQIRDMYVSNNTIYLGELITLSVDEQTSQLKVKRRKTNDIPKALKDIGITNDDILTATFGADHGKQLSDLTLGHYRRYARNNLTIGGKSGDDIEISDIFTNDADNWEEDISLETLNNTLTQIQENMDISGNLTVGGNITSTSGYFIGDGSQLTGISAGANLTNYSDASFGSVDINNTLTIINNNNDIYYQQIGSDIYGEAIEDKSGWTVSLNNDGTIVAIGAPNNDGAGGNSGHVRVYQYSNSSWIQLGSDIDGEGSNNFVGDRTSISLSSNGFRIAIGAYFPNNKRGKTSVFQYDINTSSWSKLGNTIDGEETYDESGTAVSLSSDGTILAISAPGNDGGGKDSGHVRVYQYNSNTDSWTQLGSDIDGEAIEDNFASFDHGTISLSSDGTILAIGALMNDGGGENSGHVRVYQYSNSSWIQLGSDIDGEAAGDYAGQVSLSSDGTILAIGASHHNGIFNGSGQVKVYQYSNSSWTQLGNTMYGEAGGDNFGISVSLSGDGNTLIVGAKNNDANGNNSGHARIFKYISGSWTQIGSDIDGKAVGDNFGHSVAISKNGSVVAIGGPYNDDSGYEVGIVQLYEIIQQNNIQIINGNISGVNTITATTFFGDGSQLDGITDTTYTAGSGLSLSGTTFINTAPDQTVTITQGGATTVSGEYPNFIITSTDTNTTYSAGTGVTLSGTTFSIGQNVATTSTVTFYHGHFTFCNCSYGFFNRMYGAQYYNQNVFLAFGLPNGDTRFFYTENGGSNYALITSDDRLKFNETTLTNGISTINKLNPVLYDKMPYDPTEEIDFLPYDPSLSRIEAGFIAQELLNIPELKDSVFSGKDPTKHAYMMNYNFILAYNVKATQELDVIVQNQQTVINEQNTRIQELEAENTTIKNALNQLLSDAGKPTI